MGCVQANAMARQTTDTTSRYATKEEMAEFAAMLSGKLALDAEADGNRSALIRASEACLRDNQQRLEDEDFNTELYTDGVVYDDPTLVVHPRPGDLDGED